MANESESNLWLHESIAHASHPEHMHKDYVSSFHLRNVTIISWEYQTRLSAWGIILYWKTHGLRHKSHEMKGCVVEVHVATFIFFACQSSSWWHLLGWRSLFETLLKCHHVGIMASRRLNALLGSENPWSFPGPGSNFGIGLKCQNQIDRCRLISEDWFIVTCKII